MDYEKLLYRGQKFLRKNHTGSIHVERDGNIGVILMEGDFSHLQCYHVEFQESRSKVQQDVAEGLLAMINGLTNREEVYFASASKEGILAIFDHENYRYKLSNIKIVHSETIRK